MLDIRIASIVSRCVRDQGLPADSVLDQWLGRNFSVPCPLPDRSKKTVFGHPPEGPAGDMSRHHTHLNARRWGVVRRRVFVRDGWRCVECGRAGRMEVDHIVPMQREPGQDPYDVNGLQTVCRVVG